MIEGAPADDVDVGVVDARDVAGTRVTDGVVLEVDAPELLVDEAAETPLATEDVPEAAEAADELSAAVRLEADAELAGRAADEAVPATTADEATAADEARALAELAMTGVTELADRDVEPAAVLDATADELCAPLGVVCAPSATWVGEDSSLTKLAALAGKEAVAVYEMLLKT
ncbi:hypothetical protein BAUCODRAFT_151658 [Baudoinia panamericana UAMH 10762]|uniref:Uncharacterized protein n=1 Tax=Baudoinia panamericana (strain UAMH 10762) TaxID=717646 RepID=M2MZY2_BAUPA|nr:uncharacterized protein BAUCODRAFT_151658 [Baudoinia panamericana UAMH 10762]EMC92234.1 hypothetical protein BAUCODRAFT_151658 [Baudoinia panamericana UAMH 10762]